MFSQPIIGAALVAALIAGAVSFVSTPLVIKLAWKFGLIDDPARHRHPKVIHKKPTPRGGGLAILLGVLTAALLFLPIDQHLKGILGGAIFIVIVGLADDKWNLNPYLRLLLQFTAAAIPIAAGIGIAFVTNPISGGIIDLSQPQINFYLGGEQRSLWILSDFFAVFWIVAIMNFLNMGAKGVDGQLTGVVVIAASIIAALSLQFSADITQWPVIILAAVTAGAFLGFLPWHVYPQKIMPAFAGSNLAGYLLGILAILSTAKVGTLTVVLAVPLIDTGYTIVRRMLAGKSPVWGDRGHLHHRLLDIGWSKSQVAFFYWGVTAVLGILALHLNTASKLYTILGVAVLLGGVILFLTRKKQG